MKVHYHVLKSPTLVLILCQINPVHILTSILILSSYIRLGLLSGLFSSDVPTEVMQAFLVSRKRGTCPTHPIIFNLITY